MARRMEFRPNWVSAPGETIADILRERELSLSEFSRRIGESPDAVNDLLQGRAAISIALARKLEAVLGASVEFWMSRDFRYRQEAVKLDRTEEEWISEIPIGDMIKFGWLTPIPHASEEMAACLRFFDVRNVKEWRAKYAVVARASLFRTSPSFDSRPGAVAAWLRRGEIEADGIDCRPWNAERFRASLPSLRSLTRKKEPRSFLPELKSRCAECGVAVAVVRAPNGCRASGATRFLSQDKALLLLSFRFLTDDHFWFTFFHEAGHLLLHGRQDIFLEGPDIPQTVEEREANEFAANTLLPENFVSDLFALSADVRRVMRFARRLGVSPGVVVGQLQHRGKIKHSQLNRLKRRYEWVD